MFDTLLAEIVPADMPAYRRLFAPRALACLLAMRPTIPSRRLRHRRLWAEAATDRYKQLYPFMFSMFSPIIIAVILELALLLLKWWRTGDKEQNKVTLERAYLDWQVQKYGR